MTPPNQVERQSLLQGRFSLSFFRDDSHASLVAVNDSQHLCQDCFNDCRACHFRLASFLITASIWRNYPKNVGLRLEIRFRAYAALNLSILAYDSMPQGAKSSKVPVRGCGGVFPSPLHQRAGQLRLRYQVAKSLTAYESETTLISEED